MKDSMEINSTNDSSNRESKDLDEERKIIYLSQFDESQFDESELLSMKDQNDMLQGKIDLLSEQESIIGAHTDIHEVFDNSRSG